MDESADARTKKTGAHAMNMQVLLKKLSTEADNETPDFLRYIAIFGVLVYLGLSIANWRTFDPQAFGIGFGAVLIAAGGAVRLNEGAPKVPTA